MKLFIKKITITIFCLILISTNITPIFAQDSDIESNGAVNEIEKWSQNGLIMGTAEDKFKPDEPVKKAELASLICYILNYSIKPNKAFPDVLPGAWYAAALSKAFAEGIVSTDSKGRIGPDTPVSRQEAALMIYKAFELKVINKSAYKKLKDARDVTKSCQSAVSALIEGGYLDQGQRGAFGPKVKMTKAEAIMLIGRIAGDLRNKEGEYTGDVPSNLVVNTGNVTLKNMVMEGDLYLAHGIGDKTITLDNVSINGNIILLGSGGGTIKLNKSSCMNIVVTSNLKKKTTILKRGPLDKLDFVMDSNIKVNEKLSDYNLDDNSEKDSIIEILPKKASGSSAVKKVSKPAFQSGYPKITNIKKDSIDIPVKVNKKAYIHYLAFKKGSFPTPDADLIMNHNIANGKMYSGFIMTSEGEESRIRLCNLIGNITYDIFLVAEDGSGNVSKVKKASTTTVSDSQLPEFKEGYPKVTGVQEQSFGLLLKTNKFSLIHYVLTKHCSLPDLDAEQVLDGTAGTSGRDVIFWSMGPLMNKDNEIDMCINGINPGITYDLFIVLEDLNHNVQNKVTKVTATTLGNEKIPAFKDGYPNVKIQGDSIELCLMSDVNCRAYYVITDNSDLPDLSAEQVLDLWVKNSDRTFRGSGYIEPVNDSRELKVLIEHLYDHTTYDIFIVLKDKAGSVQKNATKITATTGSFLDRLPYDQIP